VDSKEKGKTNLDIDDVAQSDLNLDDDDDDAGDKAKRGTVQTLGLGVSPQTSHSETPRTQQSSIDLTKPADGAEAPHTHNSH
jgi:hypothetical protein